MSDRVAHASIEIAGTRFGQIPRSLVLLPGLLLLGAIGYAGKWSERALLAWGAAHRIVVPDIDYVLWAILFGLLIGHTIGVPRVCRAGVATAEFWLKTGIVLLGARFVLGDVAALGLVGLAAVVVELGVSIAVMTWLGRRFGLAPKLISLLAIGASVCGVSAIIAARGAIDAKDEDAGTAIAAILALGAMAIFVFPLIGRALGLGDHAFGLFAGLAIDNTAEATAAGALWSDEAGRIAVLAKSARNASIGFVVLGFAMVWAGRGEAPPVGQKFTFLWRRFPKFVLGFLAVSLLGTCGAFSAAQTADIVALSHWAFLLTFAGIGLRTDLRALIGQGVRPFLVGAIGEIAIVLVTLALVLVAQPYLPP